MTKKFPHLIITDEDGMEIARITTLVEGQDREYVIDLPEGDTVLDTFSRTPVLPISLLKQFLEDATP